MLGPKPITKLSDHFGDYTLQIRCSKCAHARFTDPHMLAKIVGWDTPVEKFAPRMRCTKCGAKGPQLMGEPVRRPRGVPKNPH
jgi:ribosomal protein L44E